MDTDTILMIVAIVLVGSAIWVCGALGRAEWRYTLNLLL
jgi:hypothetical protein